MHAQYAYNLMTFQKLNLIPALLNNIRDAGYTLPTPIQEATIPLAVPNESSCEPALCPWGPVGLACSCRWKGEEVFFSHLISFFL